MLQNGEAIFIFFYIHNEMIASFSYNIKRKKHKNESNGVSALKRTLYIVKF